MSTPTNVEIVTAAEATRADLRAFAQRINQAIDIIKGHQDAFEDATLEHRLCIGLEIAKAQQAFGMTNEGRARLGGEAKAALSTVDIADEKPRAATSNPLGFTAWLAKETPELPRTTASRYATAFAALGLPTAEATPQRIRAKLKDINHHADKNNLPRPTLVSLVKQAKPTRAEIHEIIKNLPPPGNPLHDAREFFHVWQEDGRKLVQSGTLDDLDKAGVQTLNEFTLWLRDRIKARLK